MEKLHSLHSYQVNASLQIVPIGVDRHPYEWVDLTIEVISRSGIRYQVGPFATVLEGTYDEIMKVVHNVNKYLVEKIAPEWISNLQLQVRSGSDITSIEKTAKFQH